MSGNGALGIFQGYGVEVEYMVVDSKTLDIMAVSDRALRALSGDGGGEYPNDVELDGITVSNEFVLHVLELCNSEPEPAIGGLVQGFNGALARIRDALAPMGARLMPTSMHPWMEPHMEARLWPHYYSHVYNTYDRIFDCRRHGWANVQSSQLNVSFAGDAEFGSLVAAVRFLMPIMPAIAASSPVVEGRKSGTRDTRLVHYRTNQTLVPSVAGRVIPEPVYTEAAYRLKILEKMYTDIAPRDPEGILRHEWLNSRGAIARFDRSAVEIRVLDAQECPTADLAVAAAVTGVLKGIVTGRWADPGKIAAWPAGPLEEIFDKTVREGEDAVIDDRDYLGALGVEKPGITAGGLWSRLAGQTFAPQGANAGRLGKALGVILDKGTLSTRILRSIGGEPYTGRLKEVYLRLCDCLDNDTPYLP